MNHREKSSPLLLVGQPAEGLSVPAAAVLFDAGTSIVFVQTGGERFERRPVETGVRDAARIEITAVGPRARDIIPWQDLADGMIAYTRGGYDASYELVMDSPERVVIREHIPENAVLLVPPFERIRLLGEESGGESQPAAGEEHPEQEDESAAEEAHVPEEGPDAVADAVGDGQERRDEPPVPVRFDVAPHVGIDKHVLAEKPEQEGRACHVPETPAEAKAHLVGAAAEIINIRRRLPAYQHAVQRRMEEHGAGGKILAPPAERLHGDRLPERPGQADQRAEQPRLAKCFPPDGGNPLNRDGDADGGGRHRDALPPAVAEEEEERDQVGPEDQGIRQRPLPPDAQSPLGHAESAGRGGLGVGHSGA